MPAIYIYLYFGIFVLEALYQFSYSWDNDEAPLEWLAGAMAALVWPITLYVRFRSRLES